VIVAHQHRSISDQLADYGISHEPSSIEGKRILRNRDGVEIACCDVVGAVDLLTWLDAQPNAAEFRVAA
jgi:hypothetical protein